MGTLNLPNRLQGGGALLHSPPFLTPLTLVHPSPQQWSMGLEDLVGSFTWGHPFSPDQDIFEKQKKRELPVAPNPSSVQPDVSYMCFVLPIHPGGGFFLVPPPPCPPP